MSRRTPRFPPDVARTLQQAEGTATVHYTYPAPLDGPPPMDRVLMETPYEGLLVALVLDTKLSLRFIRTGSGREDARVGRTDVTHLVDADRHWTITMRWSLDEISVSVEASSPPRHK